MDVYTTEQEQVEMLRKWIRDFAPTVVIGAVLGLAAIYGWRYWNGLQNQKREAASTQYETILTDLGDKAKHSEAIAAGDKLIAQYGETPYASLVALKMAKVEIDDNKLDEAAKYLRMVVDKPASEVLGLVARPRLARVLLAQGKAEEALALLTTKLDPGEYAAVYEEAKGDIYTKLGRIEDARKAYEIAKSKPLDGGNNALLGMKLDDLAAAQTAGAAK